MPEEVLPKNSSHIQFNKPIVGVWFSLVHFVPGKNWLLELELVKAFA